MNRNGATGARLIELLQNTPLGQRASLLMAAASFRPSYSMEQSFRVGPIRAAFADHWQDCLRTTIPIRQLRRILNPPIRIGTVLEFNKFDYLTRSDELAAQLAELMSHLGSRLSELNLERQGVLFDPPQPPQRTPPKTVGESISNLQQLVSAGRKFPTIYADPPWPYQNEASRAAAINHYPVMSLDCIRREPVRELATENSHLHLWTTNAFLREGIDLVTEWGFTFKSCLVWVKDNIGMGNYWRVSHEFLLLGVRGNLTFKDRTLPSWILADRTIHSRKPGRIRSLIERVSPGPYLELYGREELPNSAWTVYGNQVARRYF